jgi:uncharacterized membrane protein
MGNLNVVKIIKIIAAIIIGYFALNIVLGALNIALGLIIKVLIIGALAVGVLYGVKMLNSK